MLEKFGAKAFSQSNLHLFAYCQKVQIKQKGFIRCCFWNVIVEINRWMGKIYDLIVILW